MELARNLPLAKTHAVNINGRRCEKILKFLDSEASKWVKFYIYKSEVNFIYW